MKHKKSFAVLAAAALVIVAAMSRLYVTPILMYHHIDSRSKEWKLSVSPESFTRQMEFLKAHRYRVIRLLDYVRLLKEGKPVPKKSVVITFDDGYDDNFTNALPVLKKTAFPAAIFVQVDGIGRAGYLTEEDLAIIADNGIEIGSHTLHHAYLPEMPPGTMKKEIVESKLALEKILDRPVALFSFPGGGANAEAVRLVKAAGYEGACVTHEGVGGGPKDPYALRRIRISRSCDNLVVFWFKCSGFYTWIEELRG